MEFFFEDRLHELSERLAVTMMLNPSWVDGETIEPIAGALSAQSGTNWESEGR
jgi:hypothetical protein